MIYENRLVNVVAFLAICAAIVLSPIYLLWLAGGKITDWRTRERRKPRSDIVPFWSGILITPLVVGSVVLISTCIEHFHWGPYK